MKRFIVLVICFFVLVILVGCKNNPSSPTVTPTPTPVPTPMPHNVYIKITGAYYVDGVGNTTVVSGAMADNILKNFNGTWSGGASDMIVFIPYDGHSDIVSVGAGESVHLELSIVTVWMGVTLPSVTYMTTEFYKDSDIVPMFTVDVYSAGIVIEKTYDQL